MRIVGWFMGLMLAGSFFISCADDAAVKSVRHTSKKKNDDGTNVVYYIYTDSSGFFNWDSGNDDILVYKCSTTHKTKDECAADGVSPETVPYDEFKGALETKLDEAYDAQTAKLESVEDEMEKMLDDYDDLLATEDAGVAALKAKIEKIQEQKSDMESTGWFGFGQGIVAETKEKIEEDTAAKAALTREIEGKIAADASYSGGTEHTEKQKMIATIDERIISNEAKLAELKNSGDALTKEVDALKVKLDAQQEVAAADLAEIKKKRDACKESFTKQIADLKAQHTAANTPVENKLAAFNSFYEMVKSETEYNTDAANAAAIPFKDEIFKALGIEE